jgi:hypothetical protein
METFQDFAHWRIDDFVRQMERARRRGRILPFVRGLRLSARLIYVIREFLTGTRLTANWGHLVDETGTFCSCECDVIIHRRDAHVRQWNGTSDPVMDFRFIESQGAVTVISCKSYLKSGDVDTGYCKLVEPFVRRVWLFAECCGPRSAESIRRKALEAGYEQFWYLYLWSRGTSPVPNKDGWATFVDEVKSLAR